MKENGDTASQELEGADAHGIRYLVYRNEDDLPAIMELIGKDLSEPYSIYTYRYFIHNWPQLCFVVGLLIALHILDFILLVLLLLLLISGVS